MRGAELKLKVGSVYAKIIMYDQMELQVLSSHET